MADESFISLRHAARLPRYGDILRVLIRFGFRDLLERFGLRRILMEHFLHRGRKSKPEKGVEELTAPQRMRQAFQELGPTFVKIGQLLAARSDIMPEEYRQEFAKLHDDAAPFPFDKVRDIVNLELDRPLEEIFRRFEETPIAAASIAQVHEAETLDGRRVVVKVQRPGVERIIRDDLEIIAHAAHFMERQVKFLRVQRPSQLAEELAPTLHKELNFKTEASYIEQFRHIFEDDETVYVPRVYHDLSTRRVLTMEHIEGVKVSHLQKHMLPLADRRVVARNLADLVLKQVLLEGFFHADPHPGNLFIMPENVICYVDFGMMGRLDRKTRESFANLLYAIARSDEIRATDAVLAMTEHDSIPDRRSLENDVADFISRHFYRPARRMEFGSMLQSMLSQTTRHGLWITTEIFLMLKAFSTMEDVVRNLDPEFDLIEAAVPIVMQARMKRIQPLRVSEELLETGGDFLALARDLPDELKTILRQIRRGKVEIGLEIDTLEPLLRQVVQSANRLAYALTLAALIVASSIIIHSNTNPKWHDVPLLGDLLPFLGDAPVIGLIGYLLAAYMGVRLLIAIAQRGKL